MLYSEIFYLYLEHILIYWGLSILIIIFKHFQTLRTVKKIYSIYSENYSCIPFIFPLKEAIPLVLLNQLLSLPLFLFFGKLLPAGMPTGISILSFPLLVLLEEILFYSFHRLFHTRYLYQKFHKIHHTYIHPAPHTAFYAHPVEHFLCNLFPVLFAPYLLGVFSIWWFRLALINSILSHSNVIFFNFHEVHHNLYKYNYGVIGLLDWFFKTEYRQEYIRV